MFLRSISKTNFLILNSFVNILFHTVDNRVNIVVKCVNISLFKVSNNLYYLHGGEA